MRPGVLCLLLAVVTLAVFLPVARHGYVNYDDSDYVTANAHVQSGLKWENVVWAFTSGHASNWHPLTWLSHMLDVQTLRRQAGGAAPGERGLSYRQYAAAVSAAAADDRRALAQRHGGGVVRAASAARRIGGLGLRAQGCAERASSSCSRCGPTSATRKPKAECRMQNRAARRAVATQSRDHASRHRRFTLFHPSAIFCRSLFFALGLMSKPMLVTLPFVLLLLDYWPLANANAECRTANASDTQRLTTFPFHALASWRSCLSSPWRPPRAWSRSSCNGRAGRSRPACRSGARVANALVSYVRYIGKMFWPQRPVDSLPASGPLAGCGRWLAPRLCCWRFSRLVIVLARRRPYLAVGWLWFCGTLVPVIGLVQVGIQSMADRYTYLPLIGLFIMLVWGIAELVPKRPWRAEVVGRWGRVGAGGLRAADRRGKSNSGATARRSSVMPCR